MRVNSLSLFCDASYHPGTRAAGWAAWAKRAGWDRGRLMHGRFVSPMRSANEAELAAIVNATLRLEAEGSLVGIDYLMVQSDCLRALGQIMQHVPGAADSPHQDQGLEVSPVHGLTPLEKRAVEVLSRRVSGLGLRLTLRHVRGHQGGVTGRNWVNEKCDELAKRHMREHRAELSLTKPKGKVR